MKYPYISTSMNSLLFYAKDTATLIGDESNQFSNGFKLTADESKFKNNTHEYLSNTWGVVESKEHAEFIIELAELHGFKLAQQSNRYGKFFSFDVKGFCFLDTEFIAKKYCEQITIPLPPKAKEWPQVGDEVLTSDEIGVVKSPQDSRGFYAVLIDGELSLLHNTEFEKPKSKQELLIEELQTKLCNNNAVDNYILACDIINGNIEGLSYETE